MHEDVSTNGKAPLKHKALSRLLKICRASYGHTLTSSAAGILSQRGMRGIPVSHKHTTQRITSGTQPNFRGEGGEEFRQNATAHKDQFVNKSMSNIVCSLRKHDAGINFHN